MKLTDAIKTGLDIAKTVLTEDPAPQEVQDERKLICRPCPYAVNKNKKCSFCGCNLVIKRRYLKYHCPLDPPKW